MRERAQKRLYLDTEFNGFGGSLISMALARADGGPDFYEEVEIEEPIDPWVEKHVIPKLIGRPVPYYEFRRRLHLFLKHEFLEADIHADWAEDFAHFMQAMCMPGGVQLNFSGALIMVRAPSSVEGSVNPHFALADARALAAYHEKQPHDGRAFNGNGNVSNGRRIAPKLGSTKIGSVMIGGVL